MFRIAEDHRFEQFFFTPSTTKRLENLARLFRYPLLVCMPSLAQALGDDHPHHLLDRDHRFSFLPRYERFDLLKPHLIFEDFDAIFIDPPFSNISLPQLRDTIDLLASAVPAQPALFVCYIRSREQQLLETFGRYRLERHPGNLEYQSVSAQTQSQIFLYGPPLR